MRGQLLSVIAVAGLALSASACKQGQQAQPLGNLGHLLGQAQQGKAVFLRQIAQAGSGLATHYPPQCNNPFTADRIDQNMWTRLVKAGEHAIKRSGRGRDDQFRSRPGHPHIEPGQRGKRRRIVMRAINQHHITQNHDPVDMIGQPAELPDRNSGKLGILAPMRTNGIVIGQDRGGNRMPCMVTSRGVGEIRA